VQPKAVTFPTDAKLMHRARERLVRLAKKIGVSLRQSHERVSSLPGTRPHARQRLRLRPRAPPLQNPAFFTVDAKDDRNAERASPVDEPTGV
jgi:hypothetical protein